MKEEFVDANISIKDSNSATKLCDKWYSFLFRMNRMLVHVNYILPDISYSTVWSEVLCLPGAEIQHLYFLLPINKL